MTTFPRKNWQHIRDEKLPLEKKPQIKLVFALNQIFIGNLIYLSGLPEPTKEELIKLCLCHTIFINFFMLHIPKTEKLSQHVLLTVNIFLKDLFLLLIKVSSRSCLGFKKFSLACFSGTFLSYSKTRKIIGNNH